MTPVKTVNDNIKNDTYEHDSFIGVRPSDQGDTLSETGSVVDSRMKLFVDEINYL